MLLAAWQRLTRYTFPFEQTSGELVGIVEACVRARASRFVYSRSSALSLQVKPL